ncbi:MAG: hypothetical protein HC774_06305 [Sphingomonadales bacterium]|nr:hypothetical protein [Sphingomonadales bacterium]
MRVHTLDRQALSTTLAFAGINVHSRLPSRGKCVTRQLGRIMACRMTNRNPTLLPFAAALAGVGFLSLMDAFMKEAALLIGAYTADRWGNLAYRRAQRNFGPVMATAAKLTIAQVFEIVELGGIDPDHVHTPGVYVQRVVKVSGDSNAAA